MERVDRTPGWRGTGKGMARHGRWMGRSIILWALLTALAGSLPDRSVFAEGTTAANDGHAAAGTIDLRRAPEPSEKERARVLGWHRVWREETGPLRQTLGRLGVEGRPAPVADRRWCGALGRAVLAVDRERVFPAPSYGVSARLERGLGALVLAATACFEGRSHEAAFRLAQAHAAFARAASLLRPYGVAP